MLSKAASSNIFWVFGIIWPGIEPSFTCHWWTFYSLYQYIYRYEEHTICFQTFSVWALLLRIHTWNSSPLRSHPLRLQCTCCIVPTTSGRPHGSPLVRACQWPSLQPLSSPQLSKTDARFMQDGRKAVWSIPYVSVAFFPCLKQNFIAYRSSQVSDCIFEIHQLWQWGFSRVYSNSFSSCSFEAEISLETYRMHLICRKKQPTNHLVLSKRIFFFPCVILGRFFSWSY